ncbi:hypothetical protein V8E36_002958 [Tilletia maclaganii]
MERRALRLGRALKTSGSACYQNGGCLSGRCNLSSNRCSRAWRQHLSTSTASPNSNRHSLHSSLSAAITLGLSTRASTRGQHPTAALTCVLPRSEASLGTQSVVSPYSQSFTGCFVSSYGLALYVLVYPPEYFLDLYGHPQSSEQNCPHTYSFHTSLGPPAQTTELTRTRAIPEAQTETERTRGPPGFECGEGRIRLTTHRTDCFPSLLSRNQCVTCHVFCHLSNRSARAAVKIDYPSKLAKRFKEDPPSPPLLLLVNSTPPFTRPTAAAAVIGRLSQHHAAQGPPDTITGRRLQHLLQFLCIAHLTIPAL